MQISRLHVQDQVERWTEDIVTEYVRERVQRELDDIRMTPVADCYMPGDPKRTQENCLDLEIRRTLWELFEEILLGDFSYIEEQDEPDSGTEDEESE